MQERFTDFEEYEHFLEVHPEIVHGVLLSAQEPVHVFFLAAVVPALQEQLA